MGNDQPEKIDNSPLQRLVAAIAALFLLLYLLQNWAGEDPRARLDPIGAYLPPLMMQGGDPYVRALMRTISASEANVPRPYAVIYGGGYVNSLTSHPQRCIRIVVGPNRGNCSTAAGRYQLLNTTWYRLASRYHPQALGFMNWQYYSFEPEFQDAVVYRWLSDPQVWGADISQLLRQGKLNSVLRRLSGTWTSLGYGIETNSITGRLPKIYQKMLQEELATAGNTLTGEGDRG